MDLNNRKTTNHPAALNSITGTWVHIIQQFISDLQKLYCPKRTTCADYHRLARKKTKNKMELNNKKNYNSSNNIKNNIIVFYKILQKSQ